MAEITRLFGSFAAGQDVIPEVVAELENLLEAAKRGEVRAFAMAHIDGGDITYATIRKGDKLMGQLGGAIMMLENSFIKNWADV